MTTARRDDIEGLRGIAILLVVLFHAGVRGFAGGFVAVDLFFVLSGFFITRSLLESLVSPDGLDVGDFYRRRAQRILPSLLVVLLFALTALMWLNAPIDRPDIASTIVPVAFSAGNIKFASEALNYFSSGENALLHTWSLGVEQQFYLVWPLLLAAPFWLARGRSIAPEQRAARALWIAAAVGVLSFIASVWITYSSPAWAFFGTPTRLWEFAAGGLTGVLMVRTTGDGSASASYGDAALPGYVRGIGLAAIALAVALYGRATPYPGIAALLPVAGTVLVLAGGAPSATSRVGNVLSSAPLQWLGRMSFTWYLWHWPLMTLGAVLAPDIGAIGRLGWAMAALGLAWLTHHLVETPARNRAFGVPREWMLSASVAACALVALAAVVARKDAMRDAKSPQQRAFLAARNDRMKHDCWASDMQGPTAPCAFGDTTSARTLVLLGDSHAEHWLAGFDRMGRDRGWRVVAVVKGGCPAADMSGLRNRSMEARYRECAAYREGTIKRVLELKPAAVVVSSWDHYIPFDIPASGDDAWHITPAEWERGLRRTYERLTAAGLPVVVMRGTPRTWFDVPACLSRRAATLPFAGECDFDRNRAWSVSANRAQANAARGLPVRFLDMNDQVCPPSARNRCNVVRNGTIVYTDDNHLTATFTRSLAPVLGARLAGVLSR